MMLFIARTTNEAHVFTIMYRNERRDLLKSLPPNFQRMGRGGLDHGIGHFMLFEVDSEAQAPAPLRPKSPQTSSAASDRKSAPQPWFRQAG